MSVLDRSRHNDLGLCLHSHCLLLSTAPSRSSKHSKHAKAGVCNSPCMQLLCELVIMDWRGCLPTAGSRLPLPSRFHLLEIVNPSSATSEPHIKPSQPLASIPEEAEGQLDHGNATEADSAAFSVGCALLLEAGLLEGLTSEDSDDMSSGESYASLKCCQVFSNQQQPQEDLLSVCCMSLCTDIVCSAHLTIISFLSAHSCNMPALLSVAHIPNQRSH